MPTPRSKTRAHPYDVLAAAYDTRAAPRSTVIADLLRRSRLLDARRVLDLGVGTGIVWERVGRLRPGTLVAGIDLSAGMLEVAHARPAPDLHVVRADFAALPFRARCFDVAVSIFASRHSPDLAQMLAGVARVLAPGGRLVLIDYAGDTQLRMAGMVMRCYALLGAAGSESSGRQLAPAYFAASREDDLVAAATRAGFTTASRRYHHAIEADGYEHVIDFVMNSPPVAFDLARCRPRTRAAIRAQLVAECRNQRLPRRVESRILCCVMRRSGRG
jgi:ubiquinone/menaquinone biosynthesis C-methylase UbiE